MTFLCNICQTPLLKTGKPVSCPCCGMRFWPLKEN